MPRSPRKCWPRRARRSANRAVPRPSIWPRSRQTSRHPRSRHPRSDRANGGGRPPKPKPRPSHADLDAAAAALDAAQTRHEAALRMFMRRRPNSPAAAVRPDRQAVRHCVGPAPHLLLPGIAELVHRCTVATQAIGGDRLRCAVALERLLHEGEGRLLVACLRDEAFEDFTFVIDSTPEVHHLAVQLHVHLAACRTGQSLDEVAKVMVQPSTNS